MSATTTHSTATVSVLHVVGGTAERRRMLLARLPDTGSPAITRVIRALRGPG